MNNINESNIEIVCSGSSITPKVKLDGSVLRRNSNLALVLMKAEWQERFVDAYIEDCTPEKQIKIVFEGPATWAKKIICDFESKGYKCIKPEIKGWNYSALVQRANKIVKPYKKNLDGFTDYSKPILNVYLHGSNAYATRLLNSLIDRVQIPDIPNSFGAIIGSPESDYQLSCHYSNGNKSSMEIKDLQNIKRKNGIEHISIEGENNSSLRIKLLKRRNGSTKDDYCCFFLYETGDQKRLEEALDKYRHLFVFCPRADRKVVDRVLERKKIRYEPCDIINWDNMNKTEVRKWFERFESYIAPFCFVEGIISRVDKCVTNEKALIEVNEKDIRTRLSYYKSKLDYYKQQYEEWNDIKLIAEGKKPFDGLFESNSLAFDTCRFNYFDNDIYFDKSKNYVDLKDDWKNYIQDFEIEVKGILDKLRDDLVSYLGKTQSFLNISFDPTIGFVFPSLVYPNENDFRVRENQNPISQLIEDVITMVGSKEISYIVDIESLENSCNNKHNEYINKVQRQFDEKLSKLESTICQSIELVKEKQTTITKNIRSIQNSIELFKEKIVGSEQELDSIMYRHIPITNSIKEMYELKSNFNYNKNNL